MLTLLSQRSASCDGRLIDPRIWTFLACPENKKLCLSKSGFPEKTRGRDGNKDPERLDDPEHGEDLRPASGLLGAAGSDSGDHRDYILILNSTGKDGAVSGALTSLKREYGHLEEKQKSMEAL